MNNDSLNDIISDADIAELAFNEWHHNDKNIKNDFQTGFMSGYQKAKEEYRKLMIDKINERKESIIIDKMEEEYATEIVHTRSGDIAEINPFTYDAYKTGSIDQRKIDIDKASDYLLKRLRSFRDEILGDFDTSITHEIIKFREIMNKDD